MRYVLSRFFLACQICPYHAKTNTDADAEAFTGSKEKGIFAFSATSPNTQHLAISKMSFSDVDRDRS